MYHDLFRWCVWTFIPLCECTWRECSPAFGPCLLYLQLAVMSCPFSKSRIGLKKAKNKKTKQNKTKTKQKKVGLGLDKTMKCVFPKLKKPCTCLQGFMFCVWGMKLQWIWDDSIHCWGVAWVYVEIQSICSGRQMQACFWYPTTLVNQDQMAGTAS